MIELLHQLEKKQLEELKLLLSECREGDGNTPNVYSHILKQHRTFPVNTLYYKQGKLIAFLSAYFFYKDACEVAILVAPAHRRLGIASQMLASVIPVLQSQLIEFIIITSPHQANEAWLEKKGFTYQHSEYQMQRTNLQPQLLTQPFLRFEKATLDNINELCVLGEACFPEGDEDRRHRFEQILNDRNYEIMMIYKDQALVGKAHIRWHERGATFSDIAIYPTFQRQGLGSALLSYCIDFALAEGKPKLDLDVETKNQGALNLYTRLGFHIANATDYWKIPISSLLGSS